jgi:hypothetical protein
VKSIKGNPKGKKGKMDNPEEKLQMEAKENPR